jgi:hypothetical protein
METTRTGLRPGPNAHTVRDEDGGLIPLPAGWELLPPGDAGLTRAVKAAGPTWSVEEKRGRKVFSRGVWAPAANIAAARAAVEAQRADPGYQRKLDASRRRRAEEQAEYVDEFESAVLEFLRFHPRHAAMAAALARRVTTHATPVGSGTVARTERIPVERRAEAAVIAWMRHQTTTYDDMEIVRVKGARREVRQALAAGSRLILQRYRRGDDPAPDCPLAAALAREDAPAAPPPPRPTTPPAAPTAALPTRRPLVPPLPAARAAGTFARPAPAPPAAAPGLSPSRSAGVTPSGTSVPPSGPVAASRPTAAPTAPAATEKPAPSVARPSPSAPPRPMPLPTRAAYGTATPPPRAPSPPRDPAARPATDPTRGRTPDGLPAPRDADEEARRARYLEVRARLTRSRDPSG